MKTFAIAKNLNLPAGAVTQKFAWLGVSGSGKTYGAGVFVEGLVSVGAQVVVIDTVGNWWGLRLASDGRKPGLQIPVIGGDKGDLPLSSDHGELMAQTVAETKSSLVLDVSDFTDGELRKFVTAFAKSLLMHKKRRPSPTMVVWEECQDIIPQTMYGDDAKMVGAVQRLIKRGRNYGVGTALISQRTAAVNKGCLNQIETMFAFRTTAPLDRKAITEWVDYTGAGDAARKLGKNAPGRLTEMLPELATGSCIVYSPHWLERFEVVSISKKQTFNASSTPDFDSDDRAKELGAVDLRELEAKLATVVKEAEENDVAKLKAKIHELEGRLSKAPSITAETQATLESAIATAELKVMDRDLRLAEISGLHNNLLAAYRALQMNAQRARDLITTGLGAATEATTVSAPPPPPRHVPHAAVTGDYGQQRARTVATSARKSDGLTPMERNFLTALAQYGRMGKARLRTVTGYAASGPVSTAFAKLLAEKWAVDVGGELELTPAGRRVLGDYERLPQGDRLREFLLNGSKLSTMEKKLLDVACRHHPRPVGKASVREAAGYAASGPVSTAFAKLIALGYLANHGANTVIASKELFG